MKLLGWRVSGPWIAALILLTSSLPLNAANGWTGGQEVDTVPPTAKARQSEPSLQLLLKTPVERLKPQSMTLEGDLPVNLTLRLAVPGKEDAQLWEYRYEPGESWGAGTWVVFRDGLGRLREIRIIILASSSDQDHRVGSNGTWVRLSPVKDLRRTRLDLFLAGRLVTGGWEVPGTLQDLVASEDDWVWKQTQQQINWVELLPLARSEDTRVETLQRVVHKVLSTIPVDKTALWLEDPQTRSRLACAEAISFVARDL
jgi:hypothetical protein